jgi:outer membrane immunogenic protein
MVRVSKIVGVLAVVVLMSGSAYAADPSDLKLSPYRSGVYVGAFAGYSWADLDYQEPDYPGYDRHPNINGFIGGPFFGYNYLVNKFVLGVEGDAGFGSFHKDADKSARNTYSAFDIDWNGHVRARVGYFSGPTLLYAAAGLALAGVKVDDTDPGWGEDSATHVGWTIGAGMEYALTTSLRARVEYLYDDYGSEDYRITGPYLYRAHVSLIAHTVRLGLSYCF